MSHVFLVDAERRPLTPVHPGRARLLLKAGKAAVFKRFPFTLILRQPGAPAAREPLRLKIDPGSHTTGLALVGETSGEVLWAGSSPIKGRRSSSACRSGERCAEGAGSAIHGTERRDLPTGAGRRAGYHPPRGVGYKTW